MHNGLVTVFGGSGFVGKQVVRALVRDGWRVRVAMRRPHLGHELRVPGDVGQVQLVQANLRFPESVDAALEGAELNEAKKVLATEATALVHGREAAEQAAETARKTFEEGATAQDLPSVSVPMAALSAGIGVLQLMVTAGLAKSNGEARRHVQGGAVKINDQPVRDAMVSADPSFLNEDGVMKLSFGKKKHVLIKPE